MDPLTATIVDTASVLNTARWRGDMSVRLLDKALDAQAQQALSLLSRLPALPSADTGANTGADTGADTGQRIDLVA